MGRILSEAVTACVAGVPVLNPELERLTWDTRSRARGGPVLADETVVWVDVPRVDALWRGNRVGPGGEGGIAGRYPRFVAFLEEGVPIRPPSIYLVGDRRGKVIMFEDGRHRFAVLRDLGLDRMPVVVMRDQAAELEGLVGVGDPSLKRRLMR